MSRIYIDFEFLEDGKSIDPVSVGLVGPDDATYYAVNWDANWTAVFAHEFLRQNVCQHLPMRPELKVTFEPHAPYFQNNPLGGWIDRHNAAVKPLWVIANEVRDFILSYPEPVLWGDDPCYDHVALAWLFGNMASAPLGLPFSTFNIQQELHRLGHPQLHYSLDGLRPHHALDDARATKIIHEAALRWEKRRAASLTIPAQESGCEPH